jgi:putative DNA primase/helicase
MSNSDKIDVSSSSPDHIRACRAKAKKEAGGSGRPSTNNGQEPRTDPEFYANLRQDQGNTDPAEQPSVNGETVRRPPPTPQASKAAYPKGFPPEKDRPCFRLHPEPQRIGSKDYEAGVYWHGTKEVGEDKNVVSFNELICDPLEILATTSNPEDSDYGCQLQFTSKKGVAKTIAVPSSAMMGDGIEILERLATEGLWINHPHRKRLINYIATAQPKQELNCTNTTGWYQRTTFVLPGAVYGKDAVWFQSVGRIAAYAKAGTLDGWKKGIADKAVGNPFLLFGLSCSLVGPLLQILNIEGAGVHIYGDSSHGKSTVLQAATSTWGGKEFRHEWRTTANGIESIAKSHSDTFLPMDEIGEVLAKDLSEIAYFLINGHGKVRANRYGEARPRLLFTVSLFSTGEHSVRATLAGAGLSVKVGQSLRILDVPIQGKYGVFDELHGEVSPGVFSEAIRSAAARHYGHAGPLFIEHLVKLDRADLVRQHEALLVSFGSGLDAQTRRAARVFAAVTLAGELAIKAGIVSWDEDAALAAALELFTLWDGVRTKSGLKGEQSEILRVVADFIDAHSSSRFSDINFSGVNADGFEEKEPRVINRAGYWELVGESRRFLFTHAGLQEATKGKDWLRVLQALDAAGAFYEKGADGRKAVNRRAEGRVVKLYHIDPEALAPETRAQP